MRSRLYTQEGLLYKSMWCPKPACGSPMDPHYHQGEHKMRCSKRKCRKITPVLVSVYFHTKGIPHIATRPHVRCVHTPPSVHLCIVIVPHSSRYAPHCIAVRQATKRVVPLHIVRWLTATTESSFLLFQSTDATDNSRDPSDR